MREHYVIGGILALGVAAAITFSVYAITADDDAAEVLAAPSPTPTESAVLRPTAATSPVPSTTPTAAPPDEESASLYQPVAWDHPTHVNRTPPSSLDEAIKERAVHADGWTFEGALPSAFRLGGPDEVCPTVPDAGLTQSGDWVLQIGPAPGPGAPPVPGQRSFALFPIDPALLGNLGHIEAPLRIRAIDIESWQATHLLEAWRPPDHDGAFRFNFESPRPARWMAVVTAGPLWGCFTLDLEGDTARWPSPGSIDSSWFRDAPPDDDGMDAALWEYVADGGQNQSASRACVVATGQGRTRSGEFAMGRLAGFGNHPDDGFSPFRRASKVIWLPQYQDALGDLTMRASLVEAGSSVGQTLHTYAFLAEGPNTRSASRFTYVTGPVLPQAGTWQLIATADPYNWGCFTLAVEG